MPNVTELSELVSLRLSADLRADLEANAEANGRTLSQEIRHACRTYLTGHGHGPA